MGKTIPKNSRLEAIGKTHQYPILLIELTENSARSAVKYIAAQPDLHIAVKPVPELYLKQTVPVVQRVQSQCL